LLLHAQHSCVNLSISGDESLALPLRILTAGELFLHASYYADHPHITGAAEDPSILSSDINMLYTWILSKDAGRCLDETEDRTEAVILESKIVCNNMSWSGLLAAMGLASVTGLPVTSLYPDGAEAMKALHGTIEPRTSSTLFRNKSIILMWSRYCSLDKRIGALFEPDHLVAVFQKPCDDSMKERQMKKTPSNMSQQKISFFISKASKPNPTSKLPVPKNASELSKPKDTSKLAKSTIQLSMMPKPSSQLPKPASEQPIPKPNQPCTQKPGNNPSSPKCTSTCMLPLTKSPSFMPKSNSSTDAEPGPTDHGINNINTSNIVLSTAKDKATIQSSNKVGEKPHQPSSYVFPKRTFGIKAPVHRSFQPSWFTTWPWLHYLENEDMALCHTCTRAFQTNQLSSTMVDPAFISKGYTNWKDATVKKAGFTKHENSDCHKKAVERLFTLPSTTKDVAESLSQTHEDDKAESRRVFLKILSNIKFLARQGLPLRGDGDESNSNFMQLYNLRGQDDPNLLDWLERKTNKYTSSEIQNEVLKDMGLEVLRNIASSLHTSQFYSIMADETADVSNKEQVVICIRWVDDDLEINEEFIGLYQVGTIDAATLTKVISDVLLRLNLVITKCRGQCYDGAKNMTGEKTGVATNFKAKEPRCLFTHCYGHAINLACADSIKNCDVMKDALDTSHEITKLIKKSPKRDAKLEEIRQTLPEDAVHAGIRLLCPTRWTVRADALNSIIVNFRNLQELWLWSYDHCSDTEMKARIRGVQLHSLRFDFFFGLVLGEYILQHADSLSTKLQDKKLSAAEGQSMAAFTVKTLQSKRCEEKFNAFWDRVKLLGKKNGVQEPELPRKRKAPSRYEQGKALPEYHKTPEDYYRQIYYEAIDFLMGTIRERFDQPDYKMYVNCEQLLLKAAKGEDYKSEFDKVTQFYGSDFNPSSLQCHLDTFSSNFPTKMLPKNLALCDIVSYLGSLSHGQQMIIGEVMSLTKLILVMPATNATSERSFSSLRRIKTYLRSTMTQQRLNHLMLLHVHKEKTDSLQLVDVANTFVAESEHRLRVFGRFTDKDLHVPKRKVIMRTKGTQTSLTDCELH
jgi:hypothetical protein